MARGGQFGYIFTSEIKDINEPVTVAHELGHGRFKLYHTFDKHYGGYEQGNTTNIMDYSNKTHFAKWQWDQVHDPAMVVSIFEKDEDAAMVALPCWGWFDECDDVLAILKGIKSRVDTPYSSLPLFKPDVSKKTR